LRISASVWPAIGETVVGEKMRPMIERAMMPLRRLLGRGDVELALRRWRCCGAAGLGRRVFREQPRIAARRLVLALSETLEDAACRVATKEPLQPVGHALVDVADVGKDRSRLGVLHVAIVEVFVGHRLGEIL
jgi:hypothetical protein